MSDKRSLERKVGSVARKLCCFSYVLKLGTGDAFSLVLSSLTGLMS